VAGSEGGNVLLCRVGWWHNCCGRSWARRVHKLRAGITTWITDNSKTNVPIRKEKVRLRDSPPRGTNLWHLQIGDCCLDNVAQPQLRGAVRWGSLLLQSAFPPSNSQIGDSLDHMEIGEHL